MNQQQVRNKVRPLSFVFVTAQRFDHLLTSRDQGQCVKAHRVSSLNSTAFLTGSVSPQVPAADAP